MFSKAEVLHEWMRPKEVGVYESAEGYKLVRKMFRFGLIVSVVLGLPVYALLKIFMPDEYGVSLEVVFLIHYIVVVGVVLGIVPLFMAWLEQYTTVKYRVTDKGIYISGATHRWDKIECFGFDTIEGLEEVALIRLRLYDRSIKVFLPDDESKEEIVESISERAKRVDDLEKYGPADISKYALIAVYVISLLPVFIAMIYGLRFVNVKYEMLYSLGSCTAAALVFFGVKAWEERRRRKKQQSNRGEQ